MCLSGSVRAYQTACNMEVNSLMATTGDIDTHAYLGKVRVLVERFGVPLESVEIAPYFPRISISC
jgi:hypothetical protein